MSRPDRRVGYGLGTSLLSLVMVCGTSSAFAWTPIASSRPTWCETVPYSMNAAGSADLTRAQSEEIVQQAMDDWSRVSCTGLRTNYRGTTSVAPGTYEGTPVIGWIESSWPDDPNAIGVTGPRWSGSCIIEADMLLNGVNYSWTTGSGRGSSVNAYSIVLHEGGHYVGLGHSSDSNSTMYWGYSGGIHSLNSDDQAGICALYPGSGTPTDCTVTGCPGGQECVSASDGCQPIRGDGNVCSPCGSNADCGGPEDWCIRYPGGISFCAKQCTRAADCGGSDLCADVEGVGQCIRFDATGNPTCEVISPTGCRVDSDCKASERCEASSGNCVARPTDKKGLGESCEGNDECNSGVCAVGAGGGVCTQTCEALDTRSCPAGFYCNGRITNSCEAGLCLRGTAGAAALGAACSADTGCETLLCHNGACSQPCMPLGAVGCPEGYECQLGATETCGACAVTGRLGSDCETNNDCSSRMCAIAGDNTFCTELCRAEEDCPAGFECESAGAVQVCAPTGRLGTACETNQDCLTRMCAAAGSRTFCTQLCSGEGSCPEGFACQAAGDAEVCVSESSDSGGRRGGCSVTPAPGRSGSPAAWFAVALAWAVRRRSG